MLHVAGWVRRPRVLNVCRPIRIDHVCMNAATIGIDPIVVVVVILCLVSSYNEFNSRIVADRLTKTRLQRRNKMSIES